MNRLRLELAVDILREVNAARRTAHSPPCACGCRLFLRFAEEQLSQLDADARARADARQLSIWEAIGAREAELQIERGD